MILEDDSMSLSWQDVGPARMATSGGLIPEETRPDGTAQVVTIRTESRGTIVLTVPLADAVGIWVPGAGQLVGLPADWGGVQKTSAVRSAPVGALFDASGTCLLGFGFDCMTPESTLEYGVSEEEKKFVVRLKVSDELAATLESVRLVITARGLAYETAVRELSRILRTGITPRLPSPIAADPVYSTWYAHSQQIDHETVVQDATVAAEMGLTSVFIDDGWQEHGDGRWYSGCGDWTADPAKFPNLAGTVRTLHEQGQSVSLWVAPLLLGEMSEAFAPLSRFAPQHRPSLRANVLDPRHVEVREFVAETCARLVREYGVDGLKIDFLNDAMVYAGTASAGDITDVGLAMLALLRGIDEAVEAVRPGILIEFRQPYISPAIAPFGDVIRATDCPANALQNRRSIVDLRLFADAQVTHSDPLMWDPTSPTSAVRRQLLNSVLAVPQISMALATMSTEHREQVREYVSWWRENREDLLGGELRTSLPTTSYAQVASRRQGRLLVIAHESQLLELDLEGVTDLTLVNATVSNDIPFRVVAGGGERWSSATEELDLVGRGFLAVPALSTMDFRRGLASATRGERAAEAGVSREN